MDLTPSNPTLESTEALPSAPKKEKKQRAPPQSEEIEEDGSFDDGPSLADCTASITNDATFPGGMDDAPVCLNPNDPKEVKKHRRLIRNRMSAQLHRERKKAYIDKLEAEVAHRDGVIKALQNENEKLRKLIASNGIPCEPVLEESSSDPGHTTHEDSDGTADGNATPEPRVGNKRSADGNVSSGVSLTAPSKRLAPGTLLAALACLMIFRSPSTHTAKISPATSRPVDNSHSGGRVLMSFQEDLVQSSDDDASRAMAIMPRPVASRYAKEPSPSFEYPPASQYSNSSTYFFCPSTLRSMDDFAPHRFNSTRALEEEYRLRQRYLKDQQQQLQRRREQHSTASEGSGAATGAMVPVERRRASGLGPGMSLHTSVAISKLLLAQPENETAAGPLVVHAASADDYGGRYGRNEDGGEYGSPGTAAEAHLRLVVPSSTLAGYGNTHPAGWVEIGCNMQSARFVDFSS